MLRKFQFKDQSVIFEWWNNEGLKKILSYPSASEWTKQLLNNPHAFVYDDGQVRGLFEISEIWTAGKFFQVRVFYFSPDSSLMNALLSEAIQYAKRSGALRILFYDYTPRLIEVNADQIPEPQLLPDDVDDVDTNVDTEEVHTVVVTEPAVKKTRSKKNANIYPKSDRDRKTKKEKTKDKTDITNDATSGVL